MRFFTAILIDSLNDTLKLIPFLYLTYLFLEWLEGHTGGKMEHFLKSHRRTAPIAGSLFGLIPECGISTGAGSLYTTGVISAGTLIAVFLSTSDEMLPVMISSHVSPAVILPILLVKVIVGSAAGCFADLFTKDRPVDIDAFCERENCDCEKESIFRAAFSHTWKIALWLFLFTFLLNTAVEWLGTERLRSFILYRPSLSILTASFIGMIPSCASSILLTSLYLEKVISFSAVCTGLLVNAGAGMLVLFRVNPFPKENLRILLYTWAVSVLTGFILQIL